MRGAALCHVCSGGVLLSREASLAVPSALKGLTSGFGMGPGVSPSLWPPGTLWGCMPRGLRLFPGNRTVDARRDVFFVVCRQDKFVVCAKPLGLLVPVSCAPCGVSTSGLSTQSSGWGPYPV